jgi:glucosamine 6-phosphate synthetase-like amidotransferase/phosphosugar isomerase protein
MCAIFGSFNKEMFEILHNANIQRGSWSGSMTGINEPNNKVPYVVNRWPGSAKIEEKTQKTKHSLYLGHLQAPTGANRVWAENTTHPFIIGDWVIAHNGVITNQDKLVFEYNDGVKVSVDSKLIPILANRFFNNDVACIESISKALSLIEGTFSVWIFNNKNKKVYIARQGSTLYADKKGNFSSINSSNKWEEVPEGKIFELTANGLTLAGQFKCSSPFFVL